MRIYIKPMIDEFGSSYYLIHEEGVRSPSMVLDRSELEVFIERAEEAMKKIDKIIIGGFK